MLRNMTFMVMDLEQAKNGYPKDKAKRKSREEKKVVLDKLWDKLDDNRNIEKFLQGAGTFYVGKSKAINDSLQSKNLYLL